MPDRHTFGHHEIEYFFSTTEAKCGITLLCYVRRRKLPSSFDAFKAE
jgi:hypothetical protein